MPFVHLRTHTEYSVVDGTLRIDAAAAAARADAMPALAITDLGNLFGTVKFYKACRGAGVKPLIGADVWMEPLAAAGGGDKNASRLLLLVQDQRGYLNLCELLARAWVHNAQRTQAWVKWDWLAELGERPDRAVGRRPAARWARRCWPATTRAPKSWRSAWRRCFRSASTSSCSAPACPATRRTCAPPCRWPRGWACRWWPRTRCSSWSPTTSRPTRRACASPKARRWPTRGATSASRASSTSRRRRRWRRCSPTCLRRWPTRCRSRAAAT